MPAKTYSAAVKASLRRGAARKGVKAHSMDSLYKQVRLFPFLSGFSARRKAGRDDGLGGRCRLALQMARAFADLDRLSRLADSPSADSPIPRVKRYPYRRLTPSQARRKASRKEFRSRTEVAGITPAFRFGRCWKQFRQATAVDDVRALVEAPRQVLSLATKLSGRFRSWGVVVQCSPRNGVPGYTAFGTTDLTEFALSRLHWLHRRTRLEFEALFADPVFSMSVYGIVVSYTPKHKPIPMGRDLLPSIDCLL